MTSDPDDRPNRGKLCVKGWLGWDLLEDPERLETPLVRRDGRLVEAGWDEALDAVVAAFGAGARPPAARSPGWAAPRA